MLSPFSNCNLGGKAKFIGNGGITGTLKSENPSDIKQILEKGPISKIFAGSESSARDICLYNDIPN